MNTNCSTSYNFSYNFRYTDIAERGQAIKMAGSAEGIVELTEEEMKKQPPLIRLEIQVYPPGRLERLNSNIEGLSHF
ncbi:hypothetical protein ACHWQZ_G005785 [Mnemiopsis leidyi]